MKCRSTQSECNFFELVSLQKTTKIKVELCKLDFMFVYYVFINVTLYEMCFTVIILSSKRTFCLIFYPLYAYSIFIILMYIHPGNIEDQGSKPKKGLPKCFLYFLLDCFAFSTNYPFCHFISNSCWWNLCTGRRMLNKNGWCFKVDCLFWIHGSLLLAKGSNSLKLITTLKISLQPHKWMWWFHWYWFCWNCWCDWAFKLCQWTKM